jgi:hypothetical protein
MTRRRSLFLLFVMALGVALVPAAVPPTAYAAAPSFAPLWSSHAVNFARSVAWGDVDGDGDLDLAVGGDDPLRLYINQGGDLARNPAWSSAEAAHTESVAWGDVDGDGDLDLAAGNSNAPSRLYRNDGGTLTSAAVWSAASSEQVSSIAWADVDGDGDLDLATGAREAPARIYRNDGGTLTSAPVWSAGVSENVSSIAWGDIDGDGDLDLVTGGRGAPARVYRNDGGTLTSTAVWAAGITEQLTSVAMGDVDGDGDLDLATGGRGAPVRVFRNDGGMLLDAPHWTAPRGEPTTGLAWGDGDGDGDPDLAVANEGQPSQVYWNEGGALDTSTAWSSENEYTNSVAWGDVDGDGALDLGAGNLSGHTRVYRNEDSLLTAEPVWSLPGPDDRRELAWGDVDGDGDHDLAVAGDNVPVRLYLHQGGTLSTSVAWSSDERGRVRALAWGDVDGDGDLDLGVGFLGQMVRVYSNQSGQLETTAGWSSVASASAREVAWGDVDGDGDLDLAVGNESEPDRLYRNEGGRLGDQPVWSAAGRAATTSVAWGDVDGDGDLDLAAAKALLPHVLYRNDGGMLTTAPVWSAQENNAITDVAAWVDYDGDGDLDLAVHGVMASTRLYRNDGGTLTRQAAWSGGGGLDYGMGWADYDEDGDLDLLLGREVYRNERGSLGAQPVWEGAADDLQYAVAWGDADGDGDFDVALADEGALRIYRNQRRTPVSRGDNPPHAALARPHASPAASLYTTARVEQGTSVAVTYRLFDAEGDRVARIFPEFSPNGGSVWLPATPAPGGDGVLNLAATRGGAAHTFMWNAGADLTRSDNVVFRIRAQTGAVRSEQQWPALAGHSAPLRVAAPWLVKVLDERGNPVVNADVYAGGRRLGASDRAGLLNPGQLRAGDELAVLALQAETRSYRGVHDGWAYRTYRTNIGWGADSRARPFVVAGPGEQRVTLPQTAPLVLFNLVVSIEWDADDAYLRQIEAAVRGMSAYLFDLTDGQMAIQQAAIYDNAEHWADADIQIASNNNVWPHAYIGGISGTDTARVIRVGRAWDGNSGAVGAWDRPDGYRTLAHEFGHYALRLYDSYFGYEFDERGLVRGQYSNLFCTGPENRDPARDATNASAMNHQYTTSELAMRGVPGMWGAECELSAQWQLNRNPQSGAGESDWETIARVFGDTASPPRWRLTTPADRGGVLAGPAANAWPGALPAWPALQRHADGAPAPYHTLSVVGPRGPQQGALVALYKPDRRVIGQGFTDAGGALTLYGASPGDTVRVATLDAGLTGSVVIGADRAIAVRLAPPAKTQPKSDAPPHIQVVAEPSPGAGQVNVVVTLAQFDPGAAPSVLVTPPGSDVGRTPQVSYSPATGDYRAQLTIDAGNRGTGHVQVVGRAGGSVVQLQTSYRVQAVRADEVEDIFADDGNFHLSLSAGSVPGALAYAVVAPPGAAPGPFPAGLVPVGDLYTVSVSGAVAALEKPALLRMHYDPQRLAGLDGGAVQLYRWDPAAARWEAVTSTHDADHHALAAPVRLLGTYALLAPPPPLRIFLPLTGR